MKKVKTIILSMIIIFASAFMSACSCGGGGDVEPVVETGIKLSGVTSSGEQGVWDGESALTMSCYVGDTITITYELTPSNATTTQVNWLFNKEGYIRPTNGNYFLSQSTKESVSFDARQQSNDEEIVITFSTYTTNKIATARIKVYDRVENLATLVTPENIRYNSETQEISWNPVTQCVSNAGVTMDAPTNALNGYNVEVIENGVSSTTEIKANKLGGFEAGKTYAVRVKALGNNTTAVSSEYSEQIKFYQLNTVSNLSSNNGKVSFTIPDKTTESKLYYKEGDSSLFSSIFANPGEKITKSYTDIAGQNSIDEFSFSVKAYPSDSSAFNNSYDYYLNKNDGVRYFPSKKSNNVVVRKLKAPSVSISDINSEIEVGEGEGKVTFDSDKFFITNESSAVSPVAGTQINLSYGNNVTYATALGVKFAYKIVSGDESALNAVATYLANSGLYTETTDTYIDISGCEPGQYAMRVYVVGNDDSTIDSSCTEISFEKLPTLVDDNIKIADNIISIQNVSKSYKHAQIYFVGQGDNKSSSKFVNVQPEGINIQDLGLMAGEYKIYAKLIGNNSTTSKTITGNIGVGGIQITVLNPVTTNKIESDGTISINGVENVIGYKFTINAGLDSYSSVLETSDFVVNDGVLKISLFKAIGLCLKANKIINSDRTEEDTIKYVVEYVNGISGAKNYSFAASGNGSNIIASPNSKQVTFNKVAKVNAESFGFNNRVVTFDAATIGTDIATTYVIKVNGNIIQVNSTEKLACAVIDGKVTIDLNDNSALSTAITDKIIVTGSGENTFEIYAIGREGNSSSPAYLNSDSVVTSVYTTGTPINLNLDDSGILSWSPVAYDGENWIVDESENTHYYEVKYKISTDADYLTLGNIDTNALDVSETINANVGKTLEFIVKEIASDKFTGNSSSSYYVHKLATPVLTRATGDGEYRISWNAIPGATGYSISITTIDASPETEPLVSTTITDTYYAIDTTWLENEYIISVYAYGSNDTNSAESPYYLNSESNTINFELVNAQRQLTPDGTLIKWNGIEGATSYTLTYGETPEIIENIKDTHYDVGELFTVGAYQVKVDTIIDYIETGIILIGGNTPVTINKFGIATTLGTTNGAFTFKVYDLEADVKLYLDGKELSADAINMSFIAGNDAAVGEEVEGTPYNLYTATLSGLNPGTLNLGVKLVSKAEGSRAIDGDMVTYTATKLATITDLIKTGSNLTWTPVEKATSYTINIASTGNTDPITLFVEKSGDTYNCYIGEEKTSNANVFYYDATNDKFVYVLDSASIFVASGEYKFTITASTETDTYINGNTSSETLVIKLKGQTGISVVDGNVIIADYDSSDSTNSLNNPLEVSVSISRFEINVETKDDGEGGTIETEEITTIPGAIYNFTRSSYSGSKTIDLNSYKSLQEAGTYAVKIKYYGNGNDVLDSDEYECREELIKYDTTAIYTEQGRLSWTPVSDETGYNIKFVDGEGTETIVPLADTYYTDVNSGGVSAIEEGEGEGEETPTPTQMIFVPGQTYTAYLQVTGAGISSKWSKGFEFIKLNAPTNLNIQTVDNDTIIGKDVEGNDIIITKIGTPVVAWTEANPSFTCSNEYTISYSGSETLINNATLKMYPLSTDLIGIQPIMVKVTGNSSIGTNALGLLTSDYSESIDINYIEEVGTPTITNGVISWDNVSIPSAYAYNVRVYIRSEYLTNPNTAECKYQTYTNGTSIDLSNVTFADDDYTNGYYLVVVNALTDPRNAIVTTSQDVTLSNFTTIYVPRKLSEFGVSEGRLTWQMSVTDINNFVNGQVDGEGANTLAITDDMQGTTITDKVINYIMGSVVNTQATERNAELEAQINFIYTIRLNINGVETEVVADQVSKSGNILTFYYDVAVPPVFDIEGEESDTTNSEGVTYIAGNYAIKIATIGNGNLGIAKGEYTGIINAYKPSAPAGVVIKAEETEEIADISLGYIEWFLSSLKTSDVTTYCEDYVLTITPLGAGDVVAKTIKVTSEQLNNYKFSQKIEDMFRLGDGFEIAKNTSYRLSVRTLGTAKATWSDTNNSYGYEGEGETWITDIYLNSNSYVFTDEVNILSSTELSVGVDNALTFPETSAGNDILWLNNPYSTATKLYIYGPFGETRTYDSNEYSLLDTSSTGPATILQGTSQSATTNKYYQDIIGAINMMQYGDEYSGNWGGYGTKLQFEQIVRELTFSLENDIRQTKLTLTDDDTYAPGVYIILAQELGNKKGIINSTLCDAMTVYKLDKTSKYATSSWLQNGKFVWNAVPYANAYRVSVFEVDASVTDPSTLDNINELEPLYTELHYPTNISDNKIEYEMRSNRNYNDSSKKYFVKVMATVVDNGETPSPFAYYITGDGVNSLAYARLDMPTALKIDGQGNAEWNNGTVNTIIEGYQLRVNSQSVYSTGSNAVTTTLLADKIADGTLPKSTLRIDVRAIAGENSGETYINSSYSYPQVYIINLNDPVASIIEGNLDWTPSDYVEGATLPTKSEVVISVGANDTKILSGVAYSMFTELNTENYRTYDSTDETYSAGEYDLKVRFLGSEGYASTSSGSFYLETKYSELTGVTKLATPLLTRKDVVGEDSKNRVAWAIDNNASGYKIVVFNNNTNDKYEFKLIPNGDAFGEYVSRYIVGADPRHEDMKLINNDWSNSTFFSKDVEFAYFTFTQELLTELMGETNSVDLSVYVQSIGTMEGNNGDLYISSSYSTCVSISTPPTPQNASYNSSSGELTWSVNSTNKYNIVLKTTYTVPNAVVADYETIDSNEFPEIKKRSISQAGNNVYIEDTILLLSRDYDNITPRNYKLRTIGYNYKFYLTATTYSSIEISEIGETDGVSSTLSHTNGTIGYAFNLYNSGDGSKERQYNIANEQQLASISHRLSANYVIIQDLDLQETSWSMINGDFAGTIDGQNYTIKNITYSGVGIKEGSVTNFYYTMFHTISGIVENINLETRLNLSAGSYNKVNASALSYKIASTGVISSVNVSSTDTNGLNVNVETTGINVAGLSIINDGKIADSSVNMNVTAICKGIDNTPSYAGGVTIQNTGIIEYSNYLGNITANYVAGISTVIGFNNYDGDNTTSRISNCYVGEGSVVHSITTKGEGSVSSIAGGLVGQVMNTMTGMNVCVENSYSLAKINVQGNEETYVGGLIGVFSVGTNSSTITEVKNNYAYVDYDIETSNNVDAYYLMYTRNSNVSFENNFYLLEDNIHGSISVGIGTKVTNLEALKQVLDTNIYDTAVDGYPTLLPRT